MQAKTGLSSFSFNSSYDRGRSWIVFCAWLLIKRIFFQSSFPWPTSIKVLFLRLFGAQVGSSLVIKPKVNIHFPWRLVLGDHVWIGEEVFILNFEQICVGSNCCLSQRVFLCAGGHDFRSPSFDYRNGPISIGDGSWLCAGVFVAPNVVIEKE
jgi:putative colanic acid biosynthesis acetyltransferase WcaF